MALSTSLIKVFICSIVVKGHLASGQGGIGRKVILKEDMAKHYMIKVTDSFFVMKSTYIRKNDWQGIQLALDVWGEDGKP